MNIHHDLNFEQRQAVSATEGPLLIVAGPGSGKTRVITHRVVHLIAGRRQDPEGIVAVTFTNRAAQEMKGRIKQMLPGQGEAVTACTFHSFGSQLLRRYMNRVGLSPGFTIYDQEDQLVVARNAVELGRGRAQGIGERTLLDAMSYAKSHLLNPDQYARRMGGSAFESSLADAYRFYQRLLETYNALDFDDLIMKAALLLAQDPHVRQEVQRRYKYIMVDEFQDTNPAQYQLARLLAGEQANLCVVGDPDQSIYEWRHADIRNILNFQRDYPQARRVNLGRNYRSTAVLVRAAGALVTYNRQRIDNPLVAQTPGGNAIAVIQVADETCEAQQVIRQLQELVSAEQCQWHDCAVLYRMHRQSRSFEEVCYRQRIPYRILGGIQFYQREEIKDVLAYLRLILNPGDAVAFLRIVNKPARGIDAAIVEKLHRWAERHRYTLMNAVAAVAVRELGAALDLDRSEMRAVVKFDQLMRELGQSYRRDALVTLFDKTLSLSGLDRLLQTAESGSDRWENVLELREVCWQHSDDRPAAEGALDRMLARISLLTERDDRPEAGSKLTLTTLHQAKGLEFYAVAMPGLNEGTLPLRRVEDENKESERRLCYVGMTRAKRHLILSRAATWSRGKTTPSRFLGEIPRDCCHWQEARWTAESSRPSRRRRR